MVKPDFWSQSAHSEDKIISLWVDFQRFDLTRHLTRGVQNYVKWATGLALNNQLTQTEQKSNLTDVKQTLANGDYVRGALNRHQVTDNVLSGKVNGLHLDLEIWKHATSRSLASLKATRRGTRASPRRCSLENIYWEQEPS